MLTKTFMNRTEEEVCSNNVTRIYTTDVKEKKLYWQERR